MKLSATVKKQESSQLTLSYFSMEKHSAISLRSELENLDGVTYVEQEFGDVLRVDFGVESLWVYPDGHVEGIIKGGKKRIKAIVNKYIKKKA